MAELNQAAATAVDTEETVVEELDMCCKSKKCPRVAVLSSGDLLVRDDDAGAVPVRFSAAQASQLRELLQRHNF